MELFFQRAALHRFDHLGGRQHLAADDAVHVGHHAFDFDNAVARQPFFKFGRDFCVIEFAVGNELAFGGGGHGDSLCLAAVVLQRLPCSAKLRILDEPIGVPAQVQ